jgi:hypothetical protein
MEIYLLNDISNTKPQKKPSSLKPYETTEIWLPFFQTATMTGPFETAGLTIAGLNLPAQLFSTCVLAYTTLSGIKDIGRSSGTLFWLLKVQETRFLVWGQSMDIYGRGLSEDALGRPIYEMIVAALVQICSLLEDSDKLCARYGVQQGPDIQTDATQQSIFDQEVRRQSTVVFRVQKSCSLLRKVCWFVQDRAKFADLVNELTAFNDGLYQLRPVNVGESLTVTINAEMLARAMLEDGYPGVQALMQATIGGGGSGSGRLASGASSVLGQMASARNAAQPSEVFSSGSPSQHLLIDIRQLHWLTSIPNDTPNRRSWASLSLHSQPPTTGNNSCTVTIEWRSYDPKTVFGLQKEALQERIEGLVNMLRHEPKPPGFRVLDCVGYFEDNSNPRFGLVFRFPQSPNQSSQQRAVTLYQGLLGPLSVPYLGKRFHLALTLAKSLYELHACGWLHKCISSHNILFLEDNIDPANPARQRPPVLSLDSPYFSGFALSRPDDPNTHSSQSAVEEQIGIYRHPDVYNPSGVISRYSVLHDIYSLGTLLIEIGTWERLRNFIGSSPYSRHDLRRSLLSKVVPMLGPAMGEKYMTAVRKCLDGEFDGIRGCWENPSPVRAAQDQEDYNSNLLRCFYWEVVKPLGECHV